MPPAYHTQPLYRGTTPGYAETNPQELRQEEGIGIVQSLRSPPINLLRLTAACCLNFCNGTNDAAPGALIPYMEKHYDIEYAIVSLIFLSNAAGFIFSAAVSQVLYTRIGRARTILVGVLMMALAYVVVAVTPPFGAVVLARCNVFASSLARSTTVFGYVHVRFYVLRAMASRGILWSRFYLLLLGIAIFNTCLATTPIPRPGGNTDVLSTKDILRKIKRGAEVAIGGWTVSFLITARAGDPDEVGYVVSGFWAGITVGRLVLSHLCTRIGERLSVFTLTAGSIIFQVLIWAIPNITSNAVSASLVGLLLGPLYPCVMTITTELIDKRLHVSSLTFISAFGSSGGAIAPFTTGMLASKFGAWVLHPVSIGMFVAMEIPWFLLPRMRKRSE
ncbi:MFS general substrate transporter [Choiromyces venosus 120613-1]|uniref:MFS general substrate transporter n=1 Tax=Choiromyces venosus 120613-1 TaxID=1336337 RepID=A0A3N4K5Z0_9PEZI|nr:MFS general substrate transporter [Choiromyces venosus 120613-1]